jgi:hypothetical protein
MACGEIPPIELGRGRKKGGWSDIPGPVLIATLHYAAVLPTNFTSFLQDQQKNSAAGEKIQPLIKLLIKGQFHCFFIDSLCKFVGED